MKETITRSEFHSRFEAIRPENFSYGGLEALFDYLESYEQDTGDEIELDVIGLCCDYTEYENLAEFQEAYSETEYDSIEKIEDETTVIRIAGEGFIVQNI